MTDDSGDGRDRTETGEFVRTRDPADALAAMEPLEPYTTGELAGMLDWPRRTTYEVLEELAEAGEIRKKKPEPRRAIWIREG